MCACLVVALVIGVAGGVQQAAGLDGLVSPNLVISQIYGGGGNTGAPYNSDYIEIFNRSGSAVSLAGLSLQYTSATGTGNFGSASNLITELTGGTLAPGHYLLIQESTGAVGSALPTPDVTDSTAINMSATGGKVALVKRTTPLGCNGGSTPCSDVARARIIDLIGYDGANFFEGASPAPPLSNTAAALRANDGNGCKDTDNNGADFSAASPAPRNSASPAVACEESLPPSGQGVASPFVVFQGNDVTMTAEVTPGANPTSTGLAVTADLTPIGGSAAQQFFDDGTHGDNLANDNIFTFTAPAAVTGSKDIRASITDAEGRAGVTLISFNVIANADTAPAVASTTPSNAATGVPVGSNVAITFSEPVNVTGSWYTISCGTSGGHTATVGGGSPTFTLDPTSDFAPGESCTVTVLAANVTDQDTTDPPDQMPANYSFSFSTEAPAVAIHDIQGAGHTAAILGPVSGVNGIVTAKRSNGYYMQDPNPDANDATSEGIFVFTSSAPSSVNVGDSVLVSGNVAEFRPGGSSSTNLTTTEITGPTTAVVSSGNSLPATTVIGTGGRVPPTEVIEDDASGSVETSGSFDSAQDGIDFYESLEGMRVEVNNPVVVGPRNGFGEIWALGDDGGAGAAARTARDGIVIRDLDAPFDYQSGDFNPERIQLDDNVLANSTPNANVGDHFTGPAIGVVDYEFGNFEIDVTSALTRVADGVTREVTAARAAHELTVATFNVENLAGNEPQAKYDALAAEIVTNLRSPDVLSLEEIQDNSGATNDGVVDANQTLDRLVTAIQAAGGPTYQWRQINPQNNQDGGQPGGNIRVGFLFRADRGLAFVDRPGGGSTTPTSVVSGPSGPQLTASPGRVDPTNSAWNASRKPLAGEFTYRGETFFLIANHFNSKGGDQPLFGHFQPPTRSSEVQRHQQAQIVNSFVDSILALDSNANVIVLGDLNDFEFSQTVSFLEGGVLHALMKTLPQDERYSYVFEGNSQSLDHVVVSNDLFGNPFVYDPVHVNAEFFDQISDHDPQVARFLVNSAPVVDAGGPYSVAEGGSVTLSALGTDVNGDPLTYAWDLDDNGSFETPGQTVTFSPDDGPASLTVKVRVADDSGLSSVDDTTVNVANMPPTVTAVTPNPTNSLVGEPVTFTGAATDPSEADTSAGFSWAFDAGSGFGPFGSNGFTTTYSACGTFTVDAKARDKDGGVSDPFKSGAVHVYNGTLLAPLQAGSFNLVQPGRIVPVKITIGCGTFLSGLHPAISIRAGDFDPSVDPSDPSYEVPPTNSAADTSGVMREGDQQYLYNLGVPSNATTGQLFTVLIRPFGGSAPTLYAVLKVK